MKEKIIFLVGLILVSAVFAQQVQVGTVGVNAVGVYEGCQNKLFGLVGASNTVDIDAQGNKVLSSWSNVNIIKEMCPGAMVFLQAKGGTWPGVQVSLVQAALQNDNIDYIILDPSANGQQASSSITSEEYKAAAINLAQIVKNKNKDIKVIMLTNTPLKGAGSGYGTPETVQRVKAFNADLLNNKLGRPDLIDYAVDTYSATEDPAGSDSCGKYCGGDNLHFGEAGRKLVMKAVMDTVFGDPSIATAISNAPVSQSLGVENCLNKPRCEEIDAIWLRIVVWINNAARKGRVFDTVKGWKNYPEARPTVVINQIITKSDTVSTNFCVATVGTNEQKALLDTIAWAEGTKEKYNLMFGGKEFTTYSSHPVETGEMPEKGFPWSGGTSTAAGRYQFLYGTYKDLRGRGFFQAGFLPAEQDKAGLWSLETKRGLSQNELSMAVNSGNLAPVWDKLAGEWASLPCDTTNVKIGDRTYCLEKGKSFYPGQTARSYQELKNVYQTCLQYHTTGGLSGVASSVASGVSSTASEAFDFVYGIWGGSSSPETQQGSVVSFKNSILEQACTAESLVCVIPSQNVGKQEAGGIGNCRAGMVQVGNICVDQYEAMLANKNNGEVWSPYCAPGTEMGELQAVSIGGVVPQTTINQLQAKQACENAGKRLCTDEEWLSVCQGAEGRTYPYGDILQQGMCNDQTISKPYAHVTAATVKEYCPNHQEFYNRQPAGVTYNAYPWMIHPKNNQNAVSLEATGNKAGCKTTEQVYDLVGNIAEWTSDPSGTFRGGYFQLAAGTNNGCLYKTTFHPASYTDYSIGFRCCAGLS